MTAETFAHTSTDILLWVILVVYGLVALGSFLFFIEMVIRSGWNKMLACLLCSMFIFATMMLTTSFLAKGVWLAVSAYTVAKMA